MKRTEDNTTKVPTAVHTDALAMVDDIIKDERKAKRFFYWDMRPKMSALADGYNRCYGLDISTDDVCVATHLSCWEDDWTRLRAFKGGTSLHGWVARIASQATYRLLVEEKYINVQIGSKPADYRLTVRSIANVHLRQAIVDLVCRPKLHKALEMHYVRKVDAQTLAAAFGDAEKASGILKEANKTLIEQLLNTENPYAEKALSLKKPGSPEIHWQPWHDHIEEEDVSEWQQTLRDILSQKYQTDDWDANVKEFLESIFLGMGWNEEREAIFRAKFFSDVSSKILAEKYGVDSSYIDNVYRTLTREFRRAVKSWWNKFNL